MMYTQRWRKLPCADGRERRQLTHAWRLLRQLQDALNALPERKLGGLADLRDVLEKYREDRRDRRERKSQ
jgi:hypothetical protein